MDLLQSRISEINNLNLIYIYTIDSAFKDGSNKYVGAKIVYEKNKTFELDYRDTHFEEFLRRIIEVYQEEKDSKKIILLGDLSKRLVNDDYFNTKEISTTKQESITSLSSNNAYLYKYRDLIFESVKSILYFYKKYELLDIDGMQGYNNKWIIDYKIGTVKKKAPIILYIDDESNINFRMSNIDGIFVNIYGSIKLNNNSLESTWRDYNSQVNGIVKYECDQQEISYLIKEDDEIIYREDYKTTKSEHDESLICTYKMLLGISAENFMKVGNNTYISYELKEDKVNEDETVYSVSRILLNINQDSSFYEKRTKNGLSKYKNEVLVTLDELIDTTSLIYVSDAENYFIIVENNFRNKGIDHTTYDIIHNPSQLKLDNLDSNLKKETIEEEVDTVSEIKMLVRKGRI